MVDTDLICMRCELSLQWILREILNHMNKAFNIVRSYDFCVMPLKQERILAFSHVIKLYFPSNWCTALSYHLSDGNRKH